MCIITGCTMSDERGEEEMGWWAINYVHVLLAHARRRTYTWIIVQLAACVVAELQSFVSESLHPTSMTSATRTTCIADSHMHARTQAHTQAHPHARTHARTPTCMHAHPHACTHARMHACTHGSTHIMYAHTYVLIYTNIPSLHPMCDCAAVC